MKIKLIIILFFALSFSHMLQANNLRPYNGKGPTPELHLKDLQGKVHDLQDYKGQVVLVQFWATYCAPCLKEMPSMNNLQKKMGDTPFKILAVDMGETEEEVNKFVKQVKPEFTILMDTSGETISSWNVFAAPSNFIIDPQGNIRFTLFGGVEWDSVEMVNQLKSLADK